MDNIKEKRSFRRISFILALCFFLRSFLLSNKNHIGLEDIHRLTFDIKLENIIFLVLIFVFSVLAGLVIPAIGKRFGERVTYLSVFLVAEPLVFGKQDDMLVLFIGCVAMLFLLNAFRDKPVIPREITLILFLLISTILFENANFLFVCPALILYFVGDGEKLLRNKKKIIMAVLSVVSAGAGNFINNYLVSNYAAFNDLIKKYSFFEYVYFKDIEYENIFFFVFAVPMFAFGVYFLVRYIEQCDKHGSNESSYVAVAAMVTSYIVAIIGFVIYGSEACYTINYIVPMVVFSLLANQKTLAAKALDEVNALISKYLLVFILVNAFLCFLATTTFYKNVDNIVAFIFTA